VAEQFWRADTVGEGCGGQVDGAADRRQPAIGVRRSLARPDDVDASRSWVPTFA
jgi:hypothetical protein